MQMLDEFPKQGIGRVILAGSPYNGSCVATQLYAQRAGRFVLGRSMLQWLIQEVPARNEKYDVGVIAGCRGLGGGHLICRVPFPNDGVVTVDETRIPNTKDEILLPVTHTEMLLSRELVRQACSFLRHGYFLHPPETAAAPSDAFAPGGKAKT